MRLGKVTALCDLYNLADCEEDEEADFGHVQVTEPYVVVGRGGMGVVRSLRCFGKDDGMG